MLDQPSPDIIVQGNGGTAQPLKSPTRPSKEELANTLVARGQFLVEERGMLVRNGLSTDVLLFPSDTKPEHHDHLNRKVERAIEYAARFVDVERLNALHYLPSKPSFDTDEHARERGYLTLGLYLYFADECSRKTLTRHS